MLYAVEKTRGHNSPPPMTNRVNKKLVHAYKFVPLSSFPGTCYKVSVVVVNNVVLGISLLVKGAP